jgi:predicted hydrocarbon binding protein
MTTEPPARLDGTVAARLPLVLLQTVRAIDLPEEILENEDLPASLPRRFGLSDVVARRITAYEEADREGRRIPAEEVLDLLKLVIRRPDAREVLREAGVAFARRSLGRRGRAPLPGFLRHLAARRAARSLLRALGRNGGSFAVERPLRIQSASPLTAAADELGTGCALVTGALEELAGAYLSDGTSVTHERCVRRGDDACEWVVAPSASDT